MIRSSSFCAFLAFFLALPACYPAAPEGSKSLIPIEFKLAEPGYVTLVIEDSEGKRVRNLVSQEQFPSGTNTVWWDGLDDLDRDPDAAEHAVFHIPGKIVKPGTYTVRGLTHPGLDLIYQMTPYTHGNPPWRTEDHGSEWLTNHSAPSDVVFLPAGKAPEREGKPSSRGAQLLICSKVAEGGSGLAWVDMDGNKLWGQHWLGGVWTAASHLAVDRGDHPVAGTYAYAAASWAGDKYNQYKPELRLHKILVADQKVKAPKDTRFGTGEDRPVLEPTYQMPFLPGAPEAPKDEKALREFQKKYAPELSGLAAFNGVIVCAFETLNQVLFVDAAAGKVIQSLPLPSPRGLAFDPKGQLYVLSEGKVLRYTLTSPKTIQALPKPEVLVEKLEDPQYLTVADDGTIYVSDWGNSHQVKIFNGSGKAAGVIGDPGAPSIGKYNPSHLNKPAGMALDDKGRIWVTENTHIPKRVSIWNLKDHSLVDAFYGPMRYGGSGSLDPRDKTRFFYDDDHGGAIEFKLDFETGKSTPLSILYLDEYNKTGLSGRYVGQAPSYPLHYGNFTYLTDAYSHHTTGRRSAALWRYDNDKIARIVASAGSIQDSSGDILPAFLEPSVQSKMPGGVLPEKGKTLLFVWSDLNANQKVEAAEVQFLDPKSYADPDNNNPNTGTVSLTDALDFSFSAVGNAVLQLLPTSVSKEGVPAYDLSKPKVLTTRTQSAASSGGNQVLPARDGWVITTTPVKPFARQGLGGVQNGVPIWSYPSLWPGLHASHISPLLKEPGQLVGTTRVIGNVIDSPTGSDAGQLWAINANKGTLYVFTVDGLFVARLFQDSRTTSWKAPEAKRGMKVNDLSLQEECFGPMWTRTDKGEVFLQAYATGNIIEVKNLEKVRRLPSTLLKVSAEQLQTAQRWNIDQETQRQLESAAQEKPLKAVLSGKPVVADGKTSDWARAEWALIDKRQQILGNWGRRDTPTQASISVNGGQLHVVWKTYDKDLLRSSGESLNNLFKTGGALDLMIGTDASADPARKLPVKGDQRLLVTQVKGKTVAVHYEPVSPGGKNEPVEFGSPLRTLRMDRVDVVSDKIKLASETVKDTALDKDGSFLLTTYELSVPLELLDFKPQSGKEYKIDLGILRGDGQQTLQRAYWHNKASGMVSDIPSEAELTPALWGKVIFEEPKGKKE